jgi:hypothetical protein
MAEQYGEGFVERRWTGGAGATGPPSPPLPSRSGAVAPGGG